METTETKTNNRLFRDTIIGVLLLIAALAGTLISVEYITAVKTLPLSITSLVAGAGFYTLYKTIKSDKERLEQTP